VAGCGASCEEDFPAHILGGGVVPGHLRPACILQESGEHIIGILPAYKTVPLHLGHMVMCVPSDQDVEKVSLFAGSYMCLLSKLFDVYLGPMAMYMPVIILPSFHHGICARRAVSAFQPSMTLPEAHACMPARTSNVFQRPCKYHT